MHKQKKKKQEVKKISDDKIKNLFIKYLINQIKKALEDTNKVTDKLNNALNKINGIDKRYMTNNLLTFANGNLRKEVLSNIIHLNTKRGDKELLRRYLLKWKNDKNKYINYAKKLQKFFRRTKHKKKDSTIQKNILHVWNFYESSTPNFYSKSVIRTWIREKEYTRRSNDRFGIRIIHPETAVVSGLSFRQTEGPPKVRYFNSTSTLLQHYFNTFEA